MKDKIEIWLAEPEIKSKKWKKWYGLYGIDENKNLYLLSMYAGMPEREAFFCASYDGVSVISAIHRGRTHLLFHYDWLVKMAIEKKRDVSSFPKLKEKILAFHFKTK